MTGLLRRRRLSGDVLGPSELLEWLGTDVGVRANMVASVDGRVTVGGRVGALTGPADQVPVGRSTGLVRRAAGGRGDHSG